MKKLLATTALAAALFAGAQSAKADLLQVGLAEGAAGCTTNGTTCVNGGAVHLATSTTTGAIGWTPGINYGTFHTGGNFTDNAGSFDPSVALIGQTLDSTSAAAGTLNIYVDASNQTVVSGATSWSTSFSFNDALGLNASGASVTESVYLDKNNDDLAHLILGAGGVVTNATLLKSVTSSVNMTTPFYFNTADITGPYSIIEVFSLTANAKGESFNDTINEQAVVPEPASLFLLGAGLLAVGGWSRRKRAL